MGYRLHKRRGASHFGTIAAIVLAALCLSRPPAAPAQFKLEAGEISYREQNGLFYLKVPAAQQIRHFHHLIELQFADGSRRYASYG